MINLKPSFKGSLIPAMATPLNQDLSLNRHSLKNLVDFLIEAGVGGLFVGGTTGEGILLPAEQRKELHRSVLDDVRGRVPVLVHVGANTSAETLELAEHAKKIGVDGIVVITPYFYPVHDQAMLDYFKTVAHSVEPLPLLAYDIPQMAINGISPWLVGQMRVEIPNFAGFKCSRPDAQIIRQLIDAAEDEIVVLVGNERIALGSLALGADGLISGLSTAIPEPFVAMMAAFSAGNYELARYYQHNINLLVDQLPNGARIGAIKQLLTERGIEAGPAVPPRPLPTKDWPGWSTMKGYID